jgi:hypothetical protein
VWVIGDGDGILEGVGMVELGQLGLDVDEMELVECLWRGFLIVILFKI